MSYTSISFGLCIPLMVVAFAVGWMGGVYFVSTQPHIIAVTITEEGTSIYCSDDTRVWQAPDRPFIGARCAR